MLSYVLALLVQGSATVPVTAARPSAEIPSATQPLVRGLDPNEVLCRKDTPTGHLIGTSVCRTRLEWEQIAKAVNRRNDTSRPTACFSGTASPYC